MKLRIAPVWAIVSVPWPMTMPSTPRGDLVADGVGQGDVLLRAHVLAEDAEKLLRGHVGDVGQLGHGPVELAGREGRNHRPGAVVEPRGDRAAGAQQGDALLAGIDGKLLLRDFVDGLAIAGLLGRGDPAGVDADVVAVEKLHHDVELVAGFAAGEHHALEARAAVVYDLDLAPYAEAETLHHLARRPAVALETVGAFADGDRHCSTSWPSRALTNSATSFAGALPRS